MIYLPHLKVNLPRAGGQCLMLGSVINVENIFGLRPSLSKKLFPVGRGGKETASREVVFLRVFS